MPTLDEFQNAQERYGKLGYRLIKRHGKRGARVKYQYATLKHGKEEEYPTWGELIHDFITREKEGPKLNLAE